MKTKWYEKKAVYIPFSILMGVLGFGAMYGTLLGVKADDEFNPEYYSKKDAPLFIAKKTDKKD